MMVGWWSHASLGEQHKQTWTRSKLETSHNKQTLCWVNTYSQPECIHVWTASS